MSLRDIILTGCSNQLLPVVVKEWGVTVYIKKLSVAERIELDSYKAEHKITTDTELVMLFVAAMICNENGQPVVDWKTEWKALANNSVASLVEVFNKAAEHNNMVEQRVDELEKK